jgi:aryl sulfotransferase
MDSTIWNDFNFRDDDIVVATYAKTGTTWMQQIIAQLLFDGDPNVVAGPLSPWLDSRWSTKAAKFELLEAQTHRRFIKTHLPLDALVFSPKARYVYIGRDGRNVLWSFYNHHANHTPAFYEELNAIPGRVGPPFRPPTTAIRDYWHEWLDRDGYPYWSFWDSVRSWWASRNLSNVLLVHFTNLKRDLPGEIRHIAAFLRIPIDESHWDVIVEHCTFDWMKANADIINPGADGVWHGGAPTVIHRGTNGRWVETLTQSEVAEYEARAVQELGAECALWLATGERG